MRNPEKRRKSHARGNKRYEERHRHPCIDCGKLIHQRAIRCCSCNLKYVWKTNPQRFASLSVKGPMNSSWKGGKTISQGYVYIRKPDHPRAGQNEYVAEHILIWEQTHDRPSPEGWIIHHLNGIKSDNRPVNLQALPNRKHYLVLQAKAKRIQELEALLNNQHQLL